MPLIIKNKSDRIAFQFGSKSALRSANELIDQLQAQLRAANEKLQAAYAQNRFNMAERDREIVKLLREIAELRYQLAHRDTLDAFARAPSPSVRLHWRRSKTCGSRSARYGTSVSEDMGHAGSPTIY